MEFRNIQGTSMPALGFGTWQLNGEVCLHAVRSALDIGYRHIDTAQVYENETEVGKAIQASNVGRQDLFLTTKLWTTNYAHSNVMRSVESSLSKLKTDYVDLLLIHWPNESVPLEETLDAMQDLMEQEKVNAIGVSNFPVRWLKKAIEECGAPIACNQVEYHVMLSQKPVLDYMHSKDIVLTAYSPLARGKLIQHPLLNEIGARYGKTGSQVALRWLLDQEAVAAIPKAATEKNARLNFEVFDFTLTDQERASLNALGGNVRQVNPSFSPEWDAA